MPFIKELKIHGFKSFARETTIPFRNTMNVIVGPNGSGKSNVTDAICFVLGRLGSKSMRAKRLGNLIFAGTQKYKPATEASVELIFDNKDKGFSLDKEEVSIKRVLRKNGQGIYKINNEIKTRQEIIELLSQAGIDPNGFNIVLQGEIDSFVKMPPDQRRQVIEEVAGISIYEMRKQKSLHELETTEQKLKEANAILKERTAYLRNLEDERKQALHFKKLQEDVQIFKASINHRQLSEKNEQIEEINIKIAKEQELITKIAGVIEKTQGEIALLNEKINNITSNVQKSSGIEQEKLNAEIADFRAELAGLTTRKQSLESRINDTKKRKEELELTIITSEKEINVFSKTKGKSVKNELDLKKKQLDEIDEQKRKLMSLKSNLSAVEQRIEEKQRQIQRAKNESDFTFTRLQQLESELSYKDNLETQQEKIIILKQGLEKIKTELNSTLKLKSEEEKSIAVNQRQIENHAKVQSQVSSLDICPLCKTKITKDHIDHVFGEAEKEKEKSNELIDTAIKNIKESEKKVKDFGLAIEKINDELANRTQDVLRLKLIADRKEVLRKYTEDIKVVEKEHMDLLKKRQSLEEQASSIKSSETNYDSMRLEVQELERHEELNLGMELTLKQRDIERDKLNLKQVARELEESSEQFKDLTLRIEERQTILEDKNDQDRALKERFRKVLDDKNKITEKVHFFERDIMHKNNEKMIAEGRINEFKIKRAEFLAQKEAFEQEGKVFVGLKIMRLPIEELRKRMDETQGLIMRIGTVNMRALEVYENIKQEYDKVQEKVNQILLEKEEIIKVIEDIDKKKKKAFVQTLEQINILFARNFSQLSTKGEASLEPVDKEELFKEGLEMLIKVGKGKYFDTHSLSGGEQSLISLSLIFAIQEYKPYSFYIFDEIDAALDRHNSERLASLLKRYMNNGQYIIITHNDSLITESPVIYGVSMQDKISKVISLEV